MKVIDELKKQIKDNRDKNITHIMFQSPIGKLIHQINLIDLNYLG